MAGSESEKGLFAFSHFLIEKAEKASSSLIYDKDSLPLQSKMLQMPYLITIT